MLAQKLRISWRIASCLRHQSSNASAAQVQDMVLVDVNEKNGIATLTMNSKPVNTLSLDFLKAFCEKLDLLEKEKVKGTILTSSLSTVFCAGLDFKELYKPDEDRINAFWTWFQESFLKLYGSSFPTAALINGHAIAGGCVYALCCEYRVMLPKFNTGLNETAVGIVPPLFVNAITRNTISPRKAELALTLGSLYSTEEALDLGLIDEIAENVEEAKARCEAFLIKSSKVPALARGLTKISFRGETLDLLRNPQNRAEDSKSFISKISRPSFQKDLEIYKQSMKNSKK